MKQLKKICLVLLLVLGLSQGQKVTAEEKLQVVTSFYPVYEFTKEVGGERIEVKRMVAGTMSPHAYEPTAKDLATLKQADVFIFSSLEMEFWVKSLLQTLSKDDLLVVSTATGPVDLDNLSHPKDSAEDHQEEIVADSADNTLTIKGLLDHYHSGDRLNIEATSKEAAAHWQWWVRPNASTEWEVLPDQKSSLLEYQMEGETLEFKVQALDATHQVLAESAPIQALVDNHEDLDPHIWLDPVLAQGQVEQICQALTQADPAGAATYRANADRFIQDLKNLDQVYQETLSQAKNRRFVVQHEAFGHLAKRYGLEQISVGGLSTEVEPSPARIGEIIQLIRHSQVPVIYYQNGANSEIAQMIASEAGVQVAELYDLESEPVGLAVEEMTYCQLMEKNLEALTLSVR